MLQLGQNPKLNQTTDRFFGHSARSYGYGASYRCCHLTAVSQRNYHASAKNDGQLVLLDQLCSNKTVAAATINQSFYVQLLGPLAPSTTG